MATYASTTRLSPTKITWVGLPSLETLECRPLSEIIITNATQKLLMNKNLINSDWFG